jgi:regulator of protease activity HflC (stomatin/prohibitin superfamily)
MPPRTDLVNTGSQLPISRPTSGSGPNFLSTLALLVPTAAGAAATMAMHSPLALIAGAAVGLFASMSPKIARQWERAVVLRMGKYQGLKGPGVFAVIPFVDSVTTWIDQRTITSPFAAEQTLTADTVPVNVDAVLFWTVHDPEKAALEVQDYVQAVSWAAQTALRDIIGRTSLSELLRGRIHIEAELQALIDQRSTPWGVTVHSVEMRDVVIPAVLQDAMSREAQAAREKQARIILGQAEVEIAQLFAEASKAYDNNPTALQLRQMNILYEGLKQKGGMMVIPSSIVDSMGPAGTLSLAALAKQHQQQEKQEQKDAADEAEGPPRLPPGQGWGG